MEMMTENKEMTENEKKKEYLRSYQEAVKREQDILDEIQRLRTDKMFPSAVNDGMPKGNYQSDLSDYAAILDEQIQLLKDERLEKVRIYAGIEKRIRQMENENEQRILRSRYIRGQTFEQIAVDLGYTYRHTIRLHGKALKSFKMS